MEVEESSDGWGNEHPSKYKDALWLGPISPPPSGTFEEEFAKAKQQDQTGP